MINENALRDTLLSLAADTKANYVMISSMVNELAALREAVIALDPKLADKVEQRSQAAAQKNALILEAGIARHDEIIRRLDVGEVC
jgi:hypothetical protein